MWARALLFALAAVGLSAVWAFSCASKRFERVAAGVMPLAERRFERLTVVMVGSGGSFENHQRLGPAVAVGRGAHVVLVDAGRALAEALRAAEIPVAQPEAVLLTSLFPENTLGLDDLLLTRALTARELPPLEVHGPQGTAALVEALLAAHAAGAAATRIGQPPAARAHEHATAAEVPLGGGEIVARAFPQPGGPLPALAWRLEVDGRSLLVSSAGWAPDALVAAGRDAALWIHPSLYGASLDGALAAGAEQPERLRADAELHTRLEDVGGLARRMGVGALVLTRLRPPPVFAFQYTRLVRESFPGRVVVAEDGMTFTP